MLITINQILTWCGVPNGRRATVIRESIPNGLIDLDYFSTEDIPTAIKGFPRNPVQEADKFSLLATYSKRITQLALWMKDKFGNNINTNAFLTAIGVAQTRETVRKTPMKTGGNLMSHKINPLFKSSGGWDAWSDAVKATLGLSYGAHGVPLLYIICLDEPVIEALYTWEEQAIARSPHIGDDYESNLKMVHVFLLNNISEESDVYAYIQ